MKNAQSVIKTTDQRKIHSSDDVAILTNRIIAASKMDASGFIATVISDAQGFDMEVVINVQHIIYVMAFTNDPIG